LRFGRQGFIANGHSRARGRRLAGRRPADARPNARTVTVLHFVIGPKPAKLARLMLAGAQSIQSREHTAIMAVRIAWTIVALIIVGAAGSYVFRVATAPDRIRERHDIAREVCLKAGGEWVLGENERKVCKRA
jgi:hypothetical protein